MIQFAYNDRLEIRFPGKPSPPVRARLRKHGFHWDDVCRCWHLARPVGIRYQSGRPIFQDGFTYALDHCRTLGLNHVQAAEIQSQYEAHGHARGARGMEVALGIA